MATPATITYWGLTSIKGTVNIADIETATIDDLITAVAADEGLPTDYYQLSLSADPSNTLSSVVGDSTLPPTLEDLGIDGTADVYCTTAQANLTKEERQIQKLEIAQVKRQADGDTTKDYYRTLNTYDAARIPNPYEDNDINPDDDENTGALQTGRPWT